MLTEINRIVSDFGFRIVLCDLRSCVCSFFVGQCESLSVTRHTTPLSTFSFFLSFFLSLVLKTQLNHLVPKGLSWTVTHLLLMVDWQWIKQNSLYVLWAGLGPQAQSQTDAPAIIFFHSPPSFSSHFSRMYYSFLPSRDHLSVSPATPPASPKSHSTRELTSFSDAFSFALQHFLNPIHHLRIHPPHLANFIWILYPHFVLRPATHVHDNLRPRPCTLHTALQMCVHFKRYKTPIDDSKIHYPT